MTTKLSPFPVGINPGSSYWADLYERIRFLVNQQLSAINWSIITGTPTTLAGYGVPTTGTGTAVLNNTPTLVTPVIGAATGTSVVLTGGITTGNTTLHTTTTNLTNGAAAGAGTLLNAPVAGNPTKWIPINDNGTTRYIPAW